MRNEILNLNLEQREVTPEVTGSLKELYDGKKDSMIAAAISAEERAVHWNERKPTLVGCSILVLGKNLDFSEPALFTGANFKPNPGMLPYPERKCAEMDALNHVLYEAGEENPDVGLIAAIVTVSESHNTGEHDRVEHDVLKPCNQCLTTYSDLLEQGRLANETMVYNARIENGKVVAWEETVLGDMLKDFQINREKITKKSLDDLLELRNQVVQEYQKRISEINLLARNQINSLNKSFDGSRKEWQEEFNDIQREKNEQIFEELDVCVGKIGKAMLSSLEEGVNKQKIVGALGVSGIKLDLQAQGFSETEKKAVLEAIEADLMESNESE